MIEKLQAVKIMSACITYDIGGDAYTFGDQVPTFSRNWAVSAWERLENGLSVSENSDVGPTISADEFFSLCGFSNFIDIDYHGRAKILLDLGQPMPEEMYARADLMFDGGTIEHIPDCFQAMSNAVLLVKKGGLLIQCVPTSCFGESYYTIDPMLLRDFYDLNGFEMIECLLYHAYAWYYSVLGQIWQHAKAKVIRPCIPEFILQARRRGMASRFARPHGALDDISQLGVLDPFDHVDQERIAYYGLPSRVFVIYVGKKRSDIKPQDIVAPIQESYPSVLQECKRRIAE